MAHKRNPTGLPAEAERGLGGRQAEGPASAEPFILAAGAAHAMAQVAEGLDIDEMAIARNLAEEQIGSDIGESVAIVAAILAHHRKG